jgi:hypothetical protein
MFHRQPWAATSHMIEPFGKWYALYHSYESLAASSMEFLASQVREASSPNLAPHHYYHTFQGANGARGPVTYKHAPRNLWHLLNSYV